MKKKIYYWSPCLTNIGTVKSTLNSAISLAKFSNIYEVKILNVFGEWTRHKEYLETNGVTVEKLTFDYYDYLPKNGFFKSRFSYLLIILISIFPLIFFLKRNKPNYFIIHLITSLPLVLFNYFNFDIKLILRISGYPKLNFFRKKLWQISEKKLFKITCPTKDLLEELNNDKIFSEKKTYLLSDAIINFKEFSIKKNEKNEIPFEHSKEGFFLAAGRFTKQKNFLYLIREFKKFCNLHPEEKLIIIGNGELKAKMINEINMNKLNHNIKILNYTNNLYSYLKSSKAFILSSLWEEVGFVIVEAAISNSFVISSNCKNGPKEFLVDGKAGILFENNQDDKLLNGLNEFINLEKGDLYKRKLLAKKNCSKYTMYNHFLSLEKIVKDF